MLKIYQFAEVYPYEEALTAMEKTALAVRREHKDEEFWLLEHPDLYTRGTSADDSELINAGDLPVYAAGRGGRFTYHGKGQRVGYLMVDLVARRLGVKEFIGTVEAWLIASLAELGVAASLKDGKIGVWVGDEKIAAIGFRILHGVSMHGFALNVAPDMTKFAGIIPCGIREFGVTSLEKQGVSVSLPAVDEILLRHCPF